MSARLVAAVLPAMDLSNIAVTRCVRYRPTLTAAMLKRAIR